MEPKQGVPDEANPRSHDEIITEMKDLTQQTAEIRAGIEQEAQIRKAVEPLEARISGLERQVEALLRLITVPAPGEPGYEEALAKEIPYFEQLEAKERAEGNPPTWTPRRRAEASLREQRRQAMKRAE